MEAHPIIRQREAERAQALVRADVAALGELFSDSLVWVHASARVETKEEFLRTLNSGATRYLSIDLEDQVVRLHGNVAVVTGLARMRAEIRGTEKALQNRYTAVWLDDRGSWRMIAWQSTAVQAAQPAGDGK
jgi:ketosteroid isomerase-like protein